MSARSVAIGLALTVPFLGTACSSTRTVPATDSHAAADHLRHPAAASASTTYDVDCRRMLQERPPGSPPRHAIASGR